MSIENRESTIQANRIPDYVKKILKLICDSGYSAYVAGGAVRDIVLGKNPHDYDIATSARPEDTVAVLNGAGIEYFDTGAKHGTITAITPEGNIEITTFREDGAYSDLRRPDEVVFKTTIEDDVRRRDFTINAMYMDSEGRISDPEGGIGDCSDHLIRAVGEPEKRFGEDALRILRGLRFSASFGFEIEKNTLDAMEKCAGELSDISGERIASELTGIVTGKYAPRAIRTGWKILSVIIPEIGICHGFDQKSHYHDQDVLEHTLSVLNNIPYIEDEGRDPELALAALFHDLGKPECFVLDQDGVGHMKGHPRVSSKIAERVLNELKYPRQTIQNVYLLINLHDTYVQTDRTAVHRFMSEYSEEIMEKLPVLQRADILAHSPLGQKRLDHLQAITDISKELKDSGAVFRIKDLDIDGNDIIELGVPKGPVVGEILSELFERYIDGKCSNSKASLMNEVRKIASTKCI